MTPPKTASLDTRKPTRKPSLKKNRKRLPEHAGQRPNQPRPDQPRHGHPVDRPVVADRRSIERDDAGNADRPQGSHPARGGRASPLGHGTDWSGQITGSGAARRPAGNAPPRPGQHDARSGPDQERAKPEILSPAGDMQTALAGLAAGADALYLGLKHFSARMQAENFSSADLLKLTDLAHADHKRVYVAMNTLLKPGEPGQAYRLIRRLADGGPDALILQDPGMLDIARQAGFSGELHLSTLANITHQKALSAVAALGANRVIVPRELSFEEVQMLCAACPPALALEIFVHGALCYCVSGRCWWSSYMGGKSGLRGRCVQPCRRVYGQKGREGRFFSCLDLALGPAARALLNLAPIRSWKIEGRKKGPHYVYYVTSAYRLLRDAPQDKDAVREAEGLLERALGRPSTRLRFPLGLSGSGVAGGSDGPEAGGGIAAGQRRGQKGGHKGGPGDEPATVTGKDAQTSSGLLCGLLGKDPDGGWQFKPRLDLLPKDFLRVGYEDEPWHCTLPLSKAAPAGIPLALRLPGTGSRAPKPGTPVFLIDRREQAVTAAIARMAARLKAGSRKSGDRPDVAGLEPRTPRPFSAGKKRQLDIRVLSSLPHGRESKEGVRPGAVQGLWLSPKAVREVSRTLYGRISWWLPPVIWPDEEALWARLILTVTRGGGRHFVCNAPWQVAFFQDRKALALTAGPFCNLANAFSLEAMRRMGFEAAIVSPELGGEDILALPASSPLPLGIVLSGYWPVGLTRHRSGPVKAQDAFTSPKGEAFWMRRYGENLWFYPAWPLDLAARRQALERAGYATFVHMDEHPPKSMTQSKRPGEFNWDVDLL